MTNTTGKSLRSEFAVSSGYAYMQSSDNAAIYRISIATPSDVTCIVLSSAVLLYQYHSLGERILYYTSSGYPVIQNPSSGKIERLEAAYYRVPRYTEYKMLGNASSRVLGIRGDPMHYFFVDCYNVNNNIFRFCYYTYLATVNNLSAAVTKPLTKP